MNISNINTTNTINSNAAYHTLEFDQIIEQLAGHTHTEAARQQALKLAPSLETKQVGIWLRETGEARRLIDEFGNPPLVSMEGLEEMVELADKGGCLTAEQLEYISITLTAVRRLKDFLSRGKQKEISLAYYELELDEMNDLREELQMQIRQGRVDDYASKLLKNLRAEIETTQNAMQMKAAAVMKANKSSLSEQFSTTRNGHICIPVKKECRYQIQGTVIDQSSSGATVFMEPSSVAKYYAELQEMIIAEENEEKRILYSLSLQVAEKIVSFRQNGRIIEKLDFIFAKGQLATEMRAIEPVMNEERRIRLVDARHPLLPMEQCVPLQFEIGGGIRGIIITGPNTGGKTVAIKTVGLISLMAQCGLQVPAGRAEICMNSQVLCDIGDGQNIAENLSTFSAHITNALDILNRVNAESLVIMDELGSGTDPAEGMGIAIAILEQLRASGCLYLVTTHYPEVKSYAEKYEGIQNARMTFDRESLRPLYHLELGEAGESCALFIAQKLGMPEKMLQRARAEAYGSKVDSDSSEADGSDSDHTASQPQNNGPKVVRAKSYKKMESTASLQTLFTRGDSVMIYPDHKIGIVCEPVNEKGVLRVQLQDKKIYINYKRIKLHVKAAELYPDDYDFSIVFDSVEERKKRHQMERKYCADLEIRNDR